MEVVQHHQKHYCLSLLSWPNAVAMVAPEVEVVDGLAVPPVDAADDDDDDGEDDDDAMHRADDVHCLSGVIDRIPVNFDRPNEDLAFGQLLPGQLVLSEVSVLAYLVPLKLSTAPNGYDSGHCVADD